MYAPAGSGAPVRSTKRRRSVRYTAATSSTSATVAPEAFTSSARMRPRNALLPSRLRSRVNCTLSPMRRAVDGGNRDARLHVALVEEHRRGEGRLERELHRTLPWVCSIGGSPPRDFTSTRPQYSPSAAAGRHRDHDAHDLTLAGLQHEAARKDAEKGRERRLAGPRRCRRCRREARQRCRTPGSRSRSRARSPRGASRC